MSHSRNMKNYIFTIVLCFSSIFCFSQINLGAGTQVIFDNTIIGFQGKGMVEWDDTWRAAGTFTFHISSAINWTVDLDAHYKLIQISDNFDLSPLAGISISSFDGVGNSTTEIGINLGAFIDFVPSDSYHIYIEPKINLGGYDSVAVSAGVLF